MKISAQITVLLVVLCMLALVAAATPASASDLRSLSYTFEIPENRNSKTTWGRDPFKPLVTTALAGPAIAVKDKDFKDLKLLAVFYNEHNPSAIINNELVYIGSYFHDQKVVDIGIGHVILLGNVGRMRLELPGIAELIDETNDQR